jgi:hypothetical protein
MRVCEFPGQVLVLKRFRGRARRAFHDLRGATPRFIALQLHPRRHKAFRLVEHMQLIARRIDRHPKRTHLMA